MKRWLACTLCLIVCAAFAAEALAAPVSTVGRRNFERARRAEQRGAFDDARAAYTSAADALGEYVAAIDSHDGVPFSSDLIMLGMSFYKAGRYDQAARVCDRVAEKDPDVFEAFAYGGLAWLRLGQTGKALDMWKRFPLTRRQMFLTDAMHTQSRALEQGAGDVATAIREVEDALLHQDAWNLSHAKSVNLPWPDMCSGAFWWRSSDAPCDASPDPAGAAAW
ncbi:tetratricopeptide repeat protein [Desulfovibrio aminophilus]|uniref:tetratricopeptide repeat protein n=1 Tax=Desulfovibrio aminophilus TaxID=81425 RepID=UPI00339B0B50